MQRASLPSHAVAAKDAIGAAFQVAKIARIIAARRGPASVESRIVSSSTSREPTPAFNCDISVRTTSRPCFTSDRCDPITATLVCAAASTSARVAAVAFPVACAFAVALRNSAAVVRGEASHSSANSWDRSSRGRRY